MAFTDSQRNDITDIMKKVVEDCLNDETYLQRLASIVSEMVVDKIDDKMDKLLKRCDIMERDELNSDFKIEDVLGQNLEDNSKLELGVQQPDSHNMGKKKNGNKQTDARPAFVPVGMTITYATPKGKSKKVKVAESDTPQAKCSSDPAASSSSPTVAVTEPAPSHTSHSASQKKSKGKSGFTENREQDQQIVGSSAPVETQNVASASENLAATPSKTHQPASNEAHNAGWYDKPQEAMTHRDPPAQANSAAVAENWDDDPVATDGEPKHHTLNAEAATWNPSSIAANTGPGKETSSNANPYRSSGTSMGRGSRSEEHNRGLEKSWNKPLNRSLPHRNTEQNYQNQSFLDSHKSSSGSAWNTNQPDSYARKSSGAANDFGEHGGSDRNQRSDTSTGDRCDRGSSGHSSREGKRNSYDSGSSSRSFGNQSYMNDHFKPSPKGHGGKSTEGGRNKSREGRTDDERGGEWRNRSRERKSRWSGNENFHGQTQDDKEFKEYWKFYKSSNKDSFEKVKEIQEDLFNMPTEYALAHCVAEDMAMGSGIAVQFSQQFKRRDELYQQKQRQGGLAILDDKGRHIYYLVTKKLSNGKPTLHTMWSSLQKLQRHMQENQVTRLAIPRIGCGLDRLEWSEVKAMLEYIFRDTDVEITVCNFQQNFGKTKQKLKQKADPNDEKRAKSNKHTKNKKSKSR